MLHKKIVQLQHTFASSPATKFLSSTILSLMEQRYFLSMSVWPTFLGGVGERRGSVSPRCRLKRLGVLPPLAVVVLAIAEGLATSMPVKMVVLPYDVKKIDFRLIETDIKAQIIQVFIYKQT